MAGFINNVTDDQLGGQMSIYDWMPESDTVANILLESSSAGIRGYIHSGKCSEAFLASRYKNPKIKKCGNNEILLAKEGVTVTAAGQKRFVTWNEYIYIMRAICEKRRGYK